MILFKKKKQGFFTTIEPELIQFRIVSRSNLRQRWTISISHHFNSNLSEELNILGFILNWAFMAVIYFRHPKSHCSANGSPAAMQFQHVEPDIKNSGKTPWLNCIFVWVMHFCISKQSQLCKETRWILIYYKNLKFHIWIDRIMKLVIRLLFIYLINRTRLISGVFCL